MMTFTPLPNSGSELPNSGGFDGLISQEAERTGVPTSLLRALVSQESSNNPQAVNPETGATGLGQLMPATADALGVTDRTDPAQSVRAAADYLREGYDKTGNTRDALRYYYGGPNRDNWGARTNTYPDAVLKRVSFDERQNLGWGPKATVKMKFTPVGSEDVAPKMSFTPVAPAAPAVDAAPSTPPIGGGEFQTSLDEPQAPTAPSAPATQPKATEQVLSELAAMPLAERATRIAMGLPVGAVETAVQMAAQIPQMATQAVGFGKALANGELTPEDFAKRTAEVTPKWVSDLANAETLQPETYAGALLSNAAGEAFHQTGRALAAPGAGIVASTQAIANGEGTEGARKRFTDLYEKVAPVTEQMLNAGLVGQMAAHPVMAAREAAKPTEAPGEPVQGAAPATPDISPTPSTEGAAGVALPVSDVLEQALRPSPAEEVGQARAAQEAEHAANAVDVAGDRSEAVAKAIAASQATGERHVAKMVGNDWVVVPENPKEASNARSVESEPAGATAEVPVGERASGDATGAAEEDTGSAAPAETPEAVGPETPEGIQDFEKRNGEVPSFDTEDKAQRYLDHRANRVPGNMKPRQQDDGTWVLSRPLRERSPAQKANDARLKAAGTSVAPEDDLLRTLGKLGGVDVTELTRDGADPEDIKRANRGVVGTRPFKPGGMSLDSAAEALGQRGWHVFDEAGRPDADMARELIHQALMGDKVYSPAGHEYWASKGAEAKARHEASQLDRADVLQSNLELRPEENQQAIHDALDSIDDVKWAQEDGTTDPKEAGALAKANEDLQIASNALTDEQFWSIVNAYTHEPINRHSREAAGQDHGPGAGGPEGRSAAFARKAAEAPSAGEGSGRATGERAAHSASWVIREKGTGRVVAETFDRKKVDALNTAKYEAVPIQEHLASLNRPALELKGETDAEIRTREALEKRQAEEAKARANAPSEKDFKLTGSDRPADVAEAAGQKTLFARNVGGTEKGFARKETPSGLPTFVRDDVAFIQPRLANSQPIRGARRIAYNIVDPQVFKAHVGEVGRERAAARAKVGEVLLDVRDNGTVAALHNIENYESARGKGYGRKAVRALLHSQDAPIRIVDIQPKAVDFWTKMGAKFPRSADYMEAQLDRFHYDLRNRSEATRGHELDRKEGTGQEPPSTAAPGETGARRREPGDSGAARPPDEVGATESDKAPPSEGLSASGDAKLARGPTFYSELSRQLSNVKTEAASPEQWASTIKNLKGVKADEVEWSGINDWLKLQGGKVTKQQVADYLAHNGVRVEETTLGGDKSATAEFDRLKVDLDALGYDVNMEADPNTGNRVVSTIRERGTGFEYSFVPGEGFEKETQGAKLPARVQEIGKRIAALEENMGTEDYAGPGETRYSQYTLPGGKNYRELLLKLPPTDVSLPQWQVIRPDGHVDSTYVSEESARIQAGHRGSGFTVRENEPKSLEGGFRSSHFDQPNILAHVRFDERTDADGHKVLFIEEIQSDWAQKGKREGFSSDKPYAFDPAKLREGELSWTYTWPSGRTSEVGKGVEKTRESAVEYMRRMADVYKKEDARSVPAGPFVGKTEAWVALALKRMIRYAAENGFDRVAWTNGEQQAARYDLSKHVDSIMYSKNEDGTYRVSALTDHGNRGNMLGESIAADKLADYVGKDVADRIIAGKGARTEVQSRVEVGGGLSRADGKDYMQKLSGVDLKIGGEGMKSFYDKIVPNVANDVLKKLGGERVEDVNLGKNELALPEGWSIFKEDDGTYMVAGPNGERAFGYASRREAIQYAHADIAYGPEPVAGVGIQRGFDITPAMREKAMEGMPLFNRYVSSGGLTADALHEALDPVLAKWKNAPEMEVVDSMDDARVPKEVRDEDAKQLAQGATGRPAAFYHDGKIYIVASESRTPAEAITYAFHEALGHYGLRGVFGDRLNDILSQIATARRPEVLAKAKQYGLDVSKPDHVLTAAEELLAEWAQSRPEMGFVQRAVAAVRQFLRSIGLDVKLSDNDILATFVIPARRFVEEGNRGIGDRAPRFARAATADIEKAPTEPKAIGAAITTGMTDAGRDREIFRGGMRAALATMDRLIGATDAALRQARDAVAKIAVPDRWKAVDEFQNGGADAVKNPALKPIFQAWEKASNERLEKVRKWGEGYLEDALPHYLSQMWKNPDDALPWYQKMMAKGPLEGRKSFLKQRTYATYKEGMSWKVFGKDDSVRYFDTEAEAKSAAGAGDTVKPPLEPISTNFVDMMQAHLAQIDKFIVMHELRRWLDKMGWVKTVKGADAMPGGFAEVKDPAFRNRANFIATDSEGNAKAVSIGIRYAVPDLIARDINNYLDPGLFKYGAWKAFRYGQNLLLSARLGLSAFHAGFTTVDTLVSHVDTGARYLLMGDVAQATKMWAKAIASPIAAPLEGRKALKQFYGEAAADPNTAAVLHFLTQGGARGRMDPTDFNNSWVAMRRAWEGGDIKGTAMKALPGVIEGVMRPIMHYLVPWQKMTARTLLAKMELDAVAEKLGKQQGDYKAIVDALGEDAMRQMAYRVVQQVDDRLGQVAYNNLFWNKVAKDVAQASIQSVGWNVGTVNVIFGGLKDIQRIFKPEQLLAPLDKAGKVRGALPRITGRLSYLISLNMTIAGAGALLNYAMTGQAPQDLRDYFFPRTGRKNPDGTDERISLPSYVKDEFAFATHPLQTVAHKLHPSLSMIYELLHNEDFYGNEIVNPDDPWTKVAKQLASYLGKSALPYSVQNAQQNAKKGASVPMTVAPFFGVTPASASVSRSPFESYVIDAYRGAYHKSQTPEQQDKAQARRDALQSLRQGEKPDLQQFTPAEKGSIARANRTPVQESDYARLSLQQKITAYDKATPDERDKFHLKKYLVRDYQRHGVDLDEDQRARVKELLN